MMTARGTPFTPRREALKQERDQLFTQVARLRAARGDATARGEAAGVDANAAGSSQELEQERLEHRPCLLFHLPFNLLRCPLTLS